MIGARQSGSAPHATSDWAAMRGAYDEIVATAVKRQHEPQRMIGDLLEAEINEKQARTLKSPRDPDRVGWRIKYQMTIAKLPLAKDIDDFDFDAAAVNETPAAGSSSSSATSF